MSRPPSVWASTALAIGVASWGVLGQSVDDAPVDYRLSFPAPEHRWMQVDVVFRALDETPLQLVMSNSSPGRYARHEFAKNLIDMSAVDGDSRVLQLERLGPSTWSVAEHGGTVHLRYRLFGDRTDGTYLAIDSTHAHLNMPASLLWARGLEDRPVRVRVAPPDGSSWRVATQLYPSDDPELFTAPNLQYLMDSPVEVSDFELRTFSVRDPRSSASPTFRVAVHHDGDAMAVDPYVAGVEAVVREAVTVFGEFPSFETGTYTFIADYLPDASRDAMEHRNSTVLTSSARLDAPAQRTQRHQAVAHEFFHAWNVERIRPRSLEPFDFTDANMSSELWLAEGFTDYYATLIMQRSGLADLSSTLARWTQTLNTVIAAPGRRLNSVAAMSRLAPFTDAATSIDPTNLGNTFVSYYTWGAAIGLGLDLTLRGRSQGAITLDDYMRRLWVRFGRPGGSSPGSVDSPYTAADAQAVLAEVAGDAEFAREFFERFIEGHDVVDYAALFDRAGLVLRRVDPDRVSLGRVRIGSNMALAEPTPFGSPLHKAGLAEGDVLAMLDGQRLVSVRDLNKMLSTKAPGDVIAVGFVRRGVPVDTTLTLDPDPRLELVSLESTGARISAEQAGFRAAWLDSGR